MYGMSPLKKSIGFIYEEKKPLRSIHQNINIVLFYLLVLTVFLQCAYVNCIIKKYFILKVSIFLSVHIYFSHLILFKIHVSNIFKLINHILWVLYLEIMKKDILKYTCLKSYLVQLLRF